MHSSNFRICPTLVMHNSQPKLNGSNDRQSILTISKCIDDFFILNTVNEIMHAVILKVTQQCHVNM